MSGNHLRILVLNVLIAIMATPLWAACPGNIIFAYARSEFPGYQQGPAIYSERMVLTKQGAGIYGRWTGVEYVQSTIYPFSLDALTLGALAAAPSVQIPGAIANCQTTAIGTTTISTHCTGEFPFDIRRDGVFWPGQATRLGEVKDGLLRFTMTPGHPFAAPMTGAVTDTPTTPINAEITHVNRHESGLFSRIAVRVSVAAPFGQMASKLRLSLDLSGAGPDPDWTTTDDTGFSTIEMRLPGNQRERDALARRITIVADTTYDGCSLRRRLGLDELLLISSITP